MDDSLLTKLKAIDVTDLPVVERGASTFTTSEYATSVGISLRSARERLAKLLKKGKLEKVRLSGSGLINAWRLKDAE